MTAYPRIAGLIVMLALVANASAGHSRSAADKVALTGCVVRAEDGDGYLLINAPREAASGSAEPRVAAPTTMGTTGVFTNLFYWLDNDDDLRPHVGHHVEIQGELKGDLKDGEIKIERKQEWTEIEVESDGRDMKARVPNTSVIAGPHPDRTLSVLVRRVDVDKVRMLAATCR